MVSTWKQTSGVQKVLILFPKAKAHENILKAIEKKGNDTVYSIWKRVFIHSPYPKTIKRSFYELLK